jgi:hypothetical protein
MSFVIEAVILCDECGVESTAYCTTVYQSRKQARNEGWVCNKNGDFCPLHRPNRKNEKNKTQADIIQSIS